MGSVFPRLIGVPWQVRLFRGRSACGAGLAVDPWHVVTCAHVAASAMEEPPGGEVSLDLPAFPELGRLTARALPEFWAPEQADGRGDVAVLRLDRRLPDNLEFAPLRRAGAVADREVTIFGFPRGLDDGVWARARVIGVGGPGREWLQVDPADMVSARIEPGFSGAGVVDSISGSVIGMVVAVSNVSPAAWIQPVDVLLTYWPALVDRLPRRLGDDPDFAQHWDPRARGAEPYLRTGWYFTGRVAALREITEWLADPGSGPAGLVVTGDPGAGKSAVLARLVTLADPTSRRTTPPHVLARSAAGTVPELGNIDAAVFLAGRSLEQVVRQVADTLGILAQRPGELVSALLTRTAPTVLVFDGLDEAVQPDRLVRELLLPLLTSQPRSATRLLLGIRRELLSSLRTGVRILDLDSPSYVDPRDLVDYVTAYLLAAEETDQIGPYSGQPALAAETAAAVARRAGANFLVAQLSALELLNRPSPVRSPGWQDTLPSTVADAMDNYLARVGEVLHHRGVSASASASAEAGTRWIGDLLTPLALAEGDGLRDDELWAQLATELGTAAYTAPDVRLLRTSPAAALFHRTDSAWRLFHQALADHLVNQYTARHGVVLRGMQDAVVRVLRRRLPRRWEDADSYTRQHLADHAAAAGVLHDFVVDGGYLLAADPLRLIPHLSTVNGSRAEQAAWAYLLAAPNLRAEADHHDRVHGLRLAARLAGVSWLAEDLARSYAHGWDSPWSHWPRLHPHHRIETGEGKVDRIAFGEIDGEPVALSCDDHYGSERSQGRLRLWNLRTGTQRGIAFGDVSSGARALAFGSADGTPLGITWGRENEQTTVARTWDLKTGQPWRAPVILPSDKVAFGQFRGRPALAVVDESARLVLVNLADGSSTVAITNVGDAHILVFGKWHGDALVTADENGAVSVWSLETGALVGSSRISSPHPMRSLVVGNVHGRPYVFVGDEECLWSVDLESPPELLGESGNSNQHLAFAEVNARPIVLSCGLDDLITVIRPDEPGTGTLSLSGHDSFVSDITVGRRAGHPVAISTGLDRTIRTWDLDTETTAWSDQSLGEVRSVTITTLPIGRVALGVGDQDARVRAWDLHTGETVVHAARAHNGFRVMSTLSLDNRPVALTLARNASGAVWDLLEATPVGRTLLTRDPDEEKESSGFFGGPGPNLAVGTLFGRPVALVANYRGQVHIWDIPTATRWKTLHTTHNGNRHDRPAITYAELSGRPVAIVGGADGLVDVWDLATGAQVGSPMSPGGRVHHIAFAWVGDLPLLACVSGHPSVMTIWNPVTGQAMGSPLKGHTAIATAVAVGSDSGRPIVASGGEDRVVRIWDLARGGCTVLDVGATVHSLAIGEGSTIVVGTSLGVACLKPVPYQADQLAKPPHAPSPPPRLE